MHSKFIRFAITASAFALALPVAARAVNPPPPADLKYAVRAQKKGLTFDGESTVNWRVADGRYTLDNESRAVIIGKMLENRSEGAIDTHGIAPVRFYEKSFRKSPYTVTFDRQASTIRFTESKVTYPIRGGEQDRASVPWQLSAIARGAPARFVPGSEWRIFVAGRRDGESWVFRVGKTEKLRTRMGEIDAVHVVRAPSADTKEQQIDIWLAPRHEWYPVRIRFSEHDGADLIEQTIAKITKR